MIHSNNNTQMWSHYQLHDHNNPHNYVILYFILTFSYHAQTLCNNDNMMIIITLMQYTGIGLIVIIIPANKEANKEPTIIPTAHHIHGKCCSDSRTHIQGKCCSYSSTRSRTNCPIHVLPCSLSRCYK